MSTSIPAGARPTARILLLDSKNRFLLLNARASDGHQFWVTPGGGLEFGESFEVAARRELYEETGLDLAVKHWVWTRRHIYMWNGEWCDQYERFFVARTDQEQIRPVAQDNYVIAHRWWALDEIQRSGELFAPRKLAEFGESIVCGEYPDPPIDCGV